MGAKVTGRVGGHLEGLLLSGQPPKAPQETSGGAGTDGGPRGHHHGLTHRRYGAALPPGAARTGVAVHVWCLSRHFSLWACLYVWR